MDMTVTAMVRFSNSTERETCAQYFIENTPLVQEFKQQIANSTDLSVSHRFDERTAGRSFVDEAAANSWINFVSGIASAHNIHCAFRIVPYVGMDHIRPTTL